MCSSRDVTKAVQSIPSATPWARIMRGEEVDDDELDELCFGRWRRVSSRFWTPIAVAALAARWLTETGIESVLDIGSGVGKACLVGALATDAEFVGVEQRASLVEVARAAAEIVGVAHRTRFLQSEVTPELILSHRAVYLYNPFGENLHAESSQLDHTVELSEMRYLRDVLMVERALARMKVGSRVVTYHGFGGRMPVDYELARTERIGSDRVRLWIKAY